MKHGKASRRANSIIYIILTLLCVVWIIPVVFLLIHSFRAEPGAAIKYLLPKNYTLDNYIRLFTETELFNFPRWYLNTLFVSVCSCILSTIYILMIS